MTSLLEHTILLESHKHRWIIALCSLALFVITACTPTETIPPDTTTPAALITVTATLPCEQTLVPPDIMEIQPAQPISGGEITVIGAGGYIQDSCGGFIEGSRSFILYLDDEPRGNLSCYVNRCEGKITLPGTLSAGTHCLSAELGGCQFEFQVRTN